MSRRWMPTEPLPGKYRLSVPVTKDSHPDLHAWLSTLPQGDIAPRARELLMIGLRAVQMGLSVPITQAVTVAAAAPVAHASQAVSQRAIHEPPKTVEEAPPVATARPLPLSSEILSASVDAPTSPKPVALNRADEGELDLLREVGESFL